MNDICCICLDDIDDKSIKQKLSCNHIIHHECFFKLMINNSTKFIECPLCRVTNYNIKWPIVTNNKILHNCCMTTDRCIYKYKDNEQCRNRPHFFNYGYCHNHNKCILKKEHYQIFLTYINYLFTNNIKNRWYTKIYFIDMAKKLIIKFKITKLDKLLNYFFIYFKENENNYDSNPLAFYEQYKLEVPDKEWVRLCKNKKIII